MSSALRRFASAQPIPTLVAMTAAVWLNNYVPPWWICPYEYTPQFSPAQRPRLSLCARAPLYRLFVRTRIRLKPTEEIPDRRGAIKGKARMPPVPRAPDHRLSHSAALVFHRGTDWWGPCCLNTGWPQRFGSLRPRRVVSNEGVLGPVSYPRGDGNPLSVCGVQSAPCVPECRGCGDKGGDETEVPLSVVEMSPNQFHNYALRDGLSV
jgi:hypothetical protein